MYFLSYLIVAPEDWKVSSVAMSCTAKSKENFSLEVPLRREVEPSKLSQSAPKRVMTEGVVTASLFSVGFEK